jgi:hypothetical protein
MSDKHSMGNTQQIAHDLATNKKTRFFNTLSNNLSKIIAQD